MKEAFQQFDTIEIHASNLTVIMVMALIILLLLIKSYLQDLAIQLHFMFMLSDTLIPQHISHVSFQHSPAQQKAKTKMMSTIQLSGQTEDDWVHNYESDKE